MSRVQTVKLEFYGNFIFTPSTTQNRAQDVDFGVLNGS